LCRRRSGLSGNLLPLLDKWQTAGPLGWTCRTTTIVDRLAKNQPTARAQGFIKIILFKVLIHAIAPGTRLAFFLLLTTLARRHFRFGIGHHDQAMPGPRVHRGSRLPARQNNKAGTGVMSASGADFFERLAIAKLRKTFSCFQTMSEEGLGEIIGLADVGFYQKDEIILRRHEMGRGLYIIVAGMAGVFNTEDLCFASLSKGEIFGEMSLLTGSRVNATVKAVQQLRTLQVAASDLDALLARHPSLRIALTRLATQRLSAQGGPLAGAAVAGLTGRLNEIQASELLQMLHENGKTGRIELGLSMGQASIVFSKGEIVAARYNDQEGVEAFFAILSETDGWFRFNSSQVHNLPPRAPIGAFMKILMEGLRLIDEKRD
jgi:CRP-like cAMP-binding protein